MTDVDPPRDPDPMAPPAEQDQPAVSTVDDGEAITGVPVISGPIPTRPDLLAEIDEERYSDDDLVRAGDMINDFDDPFPPAPGPAAPPPPVSYTHLTLPTTPYV